jgi:ferritin-like metal-binding protein YciE
MGTSGKVGNDIDTCLRDLRQLLDEHEAEEPSWRTLQVLTAEAHYADVLEPLKHRVKQAEKMIDRFSAVLHKDNGGSR